MPFQADAKTKVLALLFWLAAQSFASETSVAQQIQKSVRLVAYELNPYVSRDRSEHGYLFEIAIKAFETVGYKVNVEFYPPIRAKKMVEAGERDALIPSYSSTTDALNLVFSQPILGTQIGYIQLREAKDVKIPKDFVTRFTSITLKNLARSGEKPVRPSGELESLFGEEEGVIKSSSDRIIRLTEMLSSRHINLALVDKLQFADVLVNSRPSLINKLKFISPPLATKDFHVAISRKSPNAMELLKDFDQGLAMLQKSGEYNSILIRYGYQIKAADQETLTIGAVKNADTERMKELSQHFLNEHPRAKIQWYLLEENLLRRVVLASLALDEKLFDLITISGYDTGIYARNGWLENLKPLDTYEVSDIIPSIRDLLSQDGKLYALPFYGESSMTYYRKDLFESAGLTMPEQVTYAQLRGFAEKIHNPARGIYGICLRGKPGWGENTTVFATMANSYGGKWFDKQLRPLLDSKPWLTAGKIYIDLLQNFGPPDAHMNGYNENLQLFADGHCGMWIDATVAASYLLDPKLSKVSKTLAYTKAPSSVSSLSSGAHWISAWAMAIPKSANNEALAKEFAFWSTSKKYAQLVAKEKGWLAVPPGSRLSTHESLGYQEAAPFSAFVLKEIRTAIPDGELDAWGNPSAGPQIVGIPEFTALGTSLGINLSQALQKKMTIEKALELSQNEARQVMRASSTPCKRGADPRSESCASKK